MFVSACSNGFGGNSRRGVPRQLPSLLRQLARHTAGERHVIGATSRYATIVAYRWRETRHWCDVEVRFAKAVATTATGVTASLGCNNRLFCLGADDDEVMFLQGELDFAA